MSHLMSLVDRSQPIRLDFRHPSGAGRLTFGYAPYIIMIYFSIQSMEIVDL